MMSCKYGGNSMKYRLDRISNATVLKWTSSWETLFLPYANPRSLISTFVVRCLDNIIPGFYIRNFKPVPSFCGCAGRFESYLVENPEDRFSRDEAQIWIFQQWHQLSSTFFVYECLRLCSDQFSRNKWKLGHLNLLSWRHAFLKYFATVWLPNVCLIRKT